MFADFFIRRPIFSTVCSLIIILAGAISIPNLPVAEYPDITPPQVNVGCTYIGADAQTVETSVTIPLEQQINGIEGMRYMSSTSGNDGTCNITVVFDLDRNIDTAAVEVQNRVATATGRLPSEVRATGITVQKSSSGFVMGVGIGSEHGEYSDLFLSNYADRYIKDSVKRVKGVSDVMIFGERKYAMRLWLDPGKLARRKLTPMDVTRALAEQNIQVAAGQIGQPPAPPGLPYQMSVRAEGRLKNPSQFNEIVIKSDRNGSLTKIKDIGRAELGAENYGSVLRFNGRQAVGMGITALPSANAIEVSKAVKKELNSLSEYFPPGMRYVVAFDATNSVNESIKEVTCTLAQAIALVVLVIFVFLQNWRSTLIPAITIPVSLVGTFAFMKLCGFSINTLTLFGITLATGLVVDDAIVVVENIYRTMREKRLRGREATSAGMSEVTSAVIATSLVLGAVFIPVAFFPGTTGQLYKQFALTISFSVGISAFTALTLTPALSAMWLRREDHLTAGVFGAINWFLDWLRAAYAVTLAFSLRFKALIVACFLAGSAATYWLLQTVPSAFIPNEDQGYFFVIIQGPDGVSLNYTNRIVKQVEKVLAQFPQIKGTFAVSGFAFSGSGPSSGFVAATLANWKERPGKDETLDAIINKARGPLSEITGANVMAFNPPAIQGLGPFGGFFYELQDRKGSDVAALSDAAMKVVGAARSRPELRGVYTPFKANSPQVLVQVDRDRAKSLDVDLSDIFSTLQILLGSQYVNDFDMDNRVYRVYVQADREFRANPRDIEQFYVRSRAGTMIPLSNLVTVKQLVAPPIISHFNLFRSVEINGSSAPGVSSGQAMAAMKDLSAKLLPQGFAYEWSGISRESVESEGKAAILFVLGVVFVFLVLAAQYESFVDPLIILLAVPIAIFGALGAQSIRGLENDVFCQIGLVMLIGLASKNAILIVEFANQLRRRGLDSERAVIEAAKIRLRPILMTSIAFILGICPLLMAEGAGANSRRSLGTAVFGGMVVSTILNLYIVPTLYVLIKRLREGKPRRGRRAEPALEEMEADFSPTGEVVGYPDPSSVKDPP